MSEHVIGADLLRAKLRSIAAATPRELAQAAFAEALAIERESKRRTPVETGALRASHVTSKPVIAGGEVSVTISVGGPAAGYGLYVHENLEARHPVGQAKFLESAAHDAAPRFPEAVAARVRKLVEGR